jgi:hypothetical protein
MRTLPNVTAKDIKILWEFYHEFEAKHGHQPGTYAIGTDMMNLICPDLPKNPAINIRYARLQLFCQANSIDINALPSNTQDAVFEIAASIPVGEPDGFEEFDAAYKASVNPTAS